jgi:hypothetical protein
MNSSLKFAFFLVIQFLVAYPDLLHADTGSKGQTSRRKSSAFFSVSYTGYGNIDLITQVRMPNAGDCNITTTDRSASLKSIQWLTEWKRVSLNSVGSGTRTYSARKATISGQGNNSSSDIYDLSGCQTGYTVNNCIAPSACIQNVQTCSSEDLYQSENYPVKLTITPDKKKRNRWLVTVAGEDAAVSNCASGVINNTFFEDSPTTARFYVKKASTVRETQIPFKFEAPDLDCAETTPGLDYTCRMIVYMSGTITVKGAVIGQPFQRGNDTN